MLSSISLVTILQITFTSVVILPFPEDRDGFHFVLCSNPQGLKLWLHIVGTPVTHHSVFWATENVNKKSGFFFLFCFVFFTVDPKLKEFPKCSFMYTLMFIYSWEGEGDTESEAGSRL